VGVSTLANKLEWSSGYTSRIVSDLEKDGYVQTKKSGRQKLVSLVDIEAINQLEALFSEYTHMDLPALLAGSGLQVLYYLNERRTATELAEMTDISRTTVYRRLNELQRVGVVGKSKSRYSLNDPFPVLASIARGLLHQKHRREAKRNASGLNFIWERHNEYLFACDNDISADEFLLTGPARFADFDVPLLVRDRRHYFRTDRLKEITPAELICHMLLIDDGSRYRTYCLLLIAKHDIERTALNEYAEYYASEASIDLCTLVDALIEYLKTSGEKKIEQLPQWEEFKQTASEYEINV
jgi:DNA-binding MarR family transcriptional regulator